MRFVFIFICILLSVCSKRLELSNEQLLAIKSEANDLFNASESHVLSVDISKAIEITKLQPEKAYIANEGLFIVLDSSFAEEDGIFIP
jgi:hypothetical protein